MFALIFNLVSTSFCTKKPSGSVSGKNNASEDVVLSQWDCGNVFNSTRESRLEAKNCSHTSTQSKTCTQADPADACLSSVNLTPKCDTFAAETQTACGCDREKGDKRKSLSDDQNSSEPKKTASPICYVISDESIDGYFEEKRCENGLLSSNDNHKMPKKLSLPKLGNEDCSNDCMSDEYLTSTNAVKMNGSFSTSGKSAAFSPNIDCPFIDEEVITKFTEQNDLFAIPKN